MRKFFQTICLALISCTLLALLPAPGRSDQFDPLTNEMGQKRQAAQASQTFYVSKNGNNQGGRSWLTAWNELGEIDWEVIKPGDVINIDGGGRNGSMTYRTMLRPMVAGTADRPIVIRLAADEGRNGRAVFFGGNSQPLPECGQLDWDSSEHDTAGDAGIWFSEGISHIIVDGTKRGGIQIQGWRRAGVFFNPDRTDDGIDNNSRGITLRFMEIFNNGDVKIGPDELNGAAEPDPNAPNLFYPDAGSPGIKLAGSSHRFEFLEIHDNSGDAIQSNFTNPAGGVFNNMDDITVSNAWFYNQRAHSGIDNSPAAEVCTPTDPSGCDEQGAPQMDRSYWNYPAEPGGRRESFNWCTHNDGVQIYSSNGLNRLVIESSIFGPNLMNALILGDRGDENSTAWVNDLQINDVLITRFTNNALGMNNDQPNIGQKWSVEHLTVYGHFNKQNMGSFSIHSRGTVPEHRVAHTINVFGRSEFPNGNILFENNCEFNMYTGTINGRVADPQFMDVDATVDIFENDLSVDFATVFQENYTPTNPNCAASGSRLTSVAQLMRNFGADLDQVDASDPTEPTPVPTLVKPADTPIPIVILPVETPAGSATEEPREVAQVPQGEVIDPIESAPPAFEEHEKIVFSDETVVLIISGTSLIIFLALLFMRFTAWVPEDEV